MARWRRGADFERRVSKLGRPDLPKRVAAALKKLSENPPPSSIRLKPMEGRKDLWEARVDQGWRLILKRTKDEQGDYFVVLDIGPHDILKRY